MNRYVNYHKHTSYSNISSPDAVVTIDDYIKRAKELGHTCITSLEHGNQGNWLEVYDKCMKNNIKFIYGVEAYWVLDNSQKDNTNSHIVLLAKNHDGIKELNYVLSKAQYEGFYYKPRLSLDDIMDLENVMITSACIQFNNYGKDVTEGVISSLSKKDFYLEVQYHDTDKQREHNSFILDMANKYEIPIIAGMDSHYINYTEIPKDINKQEIFKEYKKFLETGKDNKDWKYIYDSDWFAREVFLKAKWIDYPSEDGWYKDYPTIKEVKGRFKKQGVLSKDQIEDAIKNTLIIEEFEDIKIDKSLKVPNIYKNKTIKERKEKLKNICYKNNKHEDSEHLKAIKQELHVINKTNIQDYFLTNHEIIKRAKKRGGRLTLTSRGCFTKNAIVQTENDLKPINKIKVGDKVLNKDGVFRPVLNTFEYDINEDLIEFTYQKQGSSYKKYKNQCTLDHKVLTKDGWKEAKYLKINDLLCTPKLKSKEDEIIHYKVEEDDKYCYIPIRKVKKIPNYNGKVYDLHIKDEHNYVMNNIIVHNSAPSYYINNLLGFTTIDRVDSPIQLYPERFLSVERIKAGTVPDIDFNVGNPEVFIEEQKKLLGEHSTYRMSAPTILQDKSAFKRVATAIGISNDYANTISKKYDQYNKQSKYGENVKMSDFFSDKELRIFLSGEILKGAIDSISSHACGVTTFNGDVRKELGLLKSKSELICSINGKYLEKYGYLKNDWLKVDVVDIIHDTFDRMKIEPVPFPELLEHVKNNEKVWESYRNGNTVGQNQVEKSETISKCMHYKPKSFQELSAFIAAIRPSFKTMYDKFSNREDFSYNIKDFDKLIQTKEIPSSFILYQEQIMASLIYAGIPAGESYSIIKAISKKNKDIINQAKAKFIKGFKEKTGSNKAEKVWKIIEDAAGYGFNASHSASVTGDSLYVALLKTMGIEVYASMLSIYTKSKKKDKVIRVKEEMNKKGIKLNNIEFGRDNREFNVDGNSINQNLMSIKYMNQGVADEMYRLRKHDDFIELLKNINDSNSNQIMRLAKIGFFHKFGSRLKLVKFLKLYKNLTNKSQISKDKLLEYDENIQRLVKKYCGNISEKQYNSVDFDAVRREYFNMIPNKEADKITLIKWEVDTLKYTKQDLPTGVYLIKVLTNQYYGKCKITNVQNNRPDKRVKTGKCKMKKGEYWLVKLKKYSYNYKGNKGTGLKVIKGKKILDK